MKQIIENLAMLDLIAFSKENAIDISGTHLAKNGRGYSYSLVSDKTGETLVTVTFYGDRVPTHTIAEQKDELPWHD